MTAPESSRMQKRWDAWLARFKRAMVSRGWETPGMAAEIRRVRASYDEAYLARIYATVDANVARSALNDREVSQELADAELRSREARAIEVDCARRLQALTGEDMLDGRMPTAKELEEMLKPTWDVSRDFRRRPVPFGGASIYVRSPRDGATSSVAPPSARVDPATRERR
jgi:hypothetical protein